MYIFNQNFDRIYAHPNDTLYLDATWTPDDTGVSIRIVYWYSPQKLNDSVSLSQIVFFQGTRNRDYLAAIRILHLEPWVIQERHFFIHWGYPEIETDSVWVFFPQYPYSNLGGRVDICLPPDAPLPSAEDTVQVFNLGPWNRELEYVEYAWYDGTKGASGGDSVVGTDSVFYYTFGKMDSVASDLYAGRVITRVAADSLWQDTCQCYVPCTDAACSGYDTVRIYLHLLPSRSHNIFLPQSEILCAHQDIDLFVPPAADAYRCYWLDRDSIELPYGHDTARFTVQGMRGLDGFGAGTDTREPRFFQLRLDHKLCGISFFDTLLIYDQVKPAFTLPFHDTLICRNEPVELDSLSPLA
ncbi:MAG: hypothetical protein K2I66_03380, partial [Bacteroidales bacterium]|nr:hypothetical protein [Bacteroidales bacterium]